MSEPRAVPRARAAPRPAALAALAAAALVAGCAVGPDYRRPATPLDAGFVNPGASGVAGRR